MRATFPIRTGPGRPCSSFAMAERGTDRGRARPALSGAVSTPSGWGPVWEETSTDEYGLAWIELDKEDVNYVLDPRTGDWTPRGSTWTAHWVVDASGYAPTEEYGQSVQEEVDLEPGSMSTGASSTCSGGRRPP